MKELRSPRVFSPFHVETQSEGRSIVGKRSQRASSADLFENTKKCGERILNGLVFLGILMLPAVPRGTALACDKESFCQSPTFAQRPACPHWSRAACAESLAFPTLPKEAIHLSAA